MTSFPSPPGPLISPFSSIRTPSPHHQKPNITTRSSSSPCHHKNTRHSFVSFLVTTALVFVILLGHLASIEAGVQDVSVRKTPLNDQFKELKYLTENICIVEGEKNHHLSLNGGLSFEALDEKICKTESCISEFHVSSLQPKIVSFKTKDGMYLCEDIEKLTCGKLAIPAHENANIQHFEFHPTDRARALMLVNLQHLPDVKTDEDDTEHRLYVTSNLMKDDPKDVQWEHLMSHTISATWGDLKSQKFQSDMIYGIRVLHHQTVIPTTNNLRAFYSINLGDRSRKPKDLIQHAKVFMRKDKFLFVATSDPQNNVRLHVSDNNGYTFREAEFSPAKKQLSYTILDASEGSVFINVFHDDSEPRAITWGNVYQSDATGSRFHLSLDHNRRAGKHADFHKVASMEGVYIANIVANYDDPSCAQCGDEYDLCLQHCKFVSRITFNKGGEWHPLIAPKCNPKTDAGNPDCHLHLHGFSSYKHRPIYSKKNAVGVIIANGNVGASLSPEPGNAMTFISRDAGLTWNSLTESDSFYSSSHHGGLILLASPADKQEEMRFTFTQGHPFLPFPLNGTFRFTRLIHNEQNELSKKFIVAAHETGDLSQSQMLQVDFSSLHNRDCNPIEKENSDYEYFTPHSYENQCLLGRKIQYVRKKQNAECFNPIGYEKPHKRENCQCDYVDFACDFGYMKRPKLALSMDAFECVPMGKNAPDKKAPYPCEGVYNETKGYTRVPGDSCVGGLSEQFDPVLRACPGGIGLFGTAVLLIFLALLIAFAAVLVYKNNPSVQKWFESVMSVSWSDSSSSYRYDPVQTQDHFSSDEGNDFDESVFANEPVEAVQSPSSHKHMQSEGINRRNTVGIEDGENEDNAGSFGSSDPLAGNQEKPSSNDSGDEEDLTASNIKFM